MKPKPAPVSASRKISIAWAKSAPFKVPVPKDEPERLEALHRYRVLDTPPEPELDHITLLASHICQTPVATISLVDSNRQWFKSRVGLSLSETSRDIAFCAHAIMQHDLFIVPDATKDRRFAHNPLVQAAPHIRFYAGAPLVSSDQHALGTLCVFDHKPRKLTADQETALRALSALVMSHLEMRHQIEETRRHVLQRDHERRRLRKSVRSDQALARSCSESLRKVGHEVRTTAAGLVQLLERALGQGTGREQRELLHAAHSTARSLATVARQLQQMSQKIQQRRRRV